MDKPKFDWKNINWLGVKPSKERTIIAFALLLVLAGANYLLRPPHDGATASPSKVLESAELLAPSGASTALSDAAYRPHQAAAVRWVKYQDPAEHAFTIDVPAGWRVEGGTRRFAEPDVRMSLQAVSPDGSIVIFYGDTNIPPFTLPSQMMEMAGLRTGNWYSPGLGLHLLIEPYSTGANFAAAWGVQRVAQACANVEQLAHRDRPDSSSAIDQAYASAGIQRSVMAGEASFRCTLNGTPAGGYVFAATELVRMQASAMWDVNALMGTVATAPRVPEASALLSHMTKSFTINPAWLAQQRQLNQQFGEIVEQTNRAIARRIAINSRTQEEISDMIVKDGQANSNARSNAIDRFDLFGVRNRSDYRDPETNDVIYNIDNEHAHVFFDPNTRQTIPSDSASPPCEGCRELQPVIPGQ